MGKFVIATQVKVDTYLPWDTPTDIQEAIQEHDLYLPGQQDRPLLDLDNQDVS